MKKNKSLIRCTRCKNKTEKLLTTQKICRDCHENSVKKILAYRNNTMNTPELKVKLKCPSCKQIEETVINLDQYDGLDQILIRCKCGKENLFYHIGKGEYST